MLDRMNYAASSRQARLAVPRVPVPRWVPMGMAPGRAHGGPADRCARDPAQHGDGRGCGHAAGRWAVSCVVPLVAYALFGSSPQLVVALDASTAALVATAVAPLAAGDPIRYGTGHSPASSPSSWAMLIAAACMRLGVVTKLLTRPVLLGYQAGLALVVVFSQLPRLLGLQVEHSETLPRASRSPPASTTGVFRLRCSAERRSPSS